MKTKKISIIRMIIMTVIAVCFFCNLTMVAHAENDVTEIKQTAAGENTVMVSWKKAEDAYGYNVYISTDGVTFVRTTKGSECDVYNDTKKKISNLTAGSTYYVSIEAVYKDNEGNITSGTMSDKVEVVTAPSASKIFTSSIKETKTSPNAISFKWGSVRGANRYILYVNDKKIATVKKTSAKVKVKVGSVNTVRITPVRQSTSGFLAKGGHAEAYDLYAAPGKPCKVASFKRNNYTWYPTVSNKVMIGWNKSARDKYEPSGYQVQIYSLKNKKLKTFNTKKTKVRFDIPAVKGKGFKVRVRSYVKINNKKCYGRWSDYKVVIPQAKISIQRTDETTVTVRWNKVTNAKRYYIYACNDIKAAKPLWKKVAVVGPNTGKYEYNNCIVGRSTAIYVIPEVKVGKSLYKAAYVWYLYMDIK